MWAVLCEPDDAAAFWACEGLKATGLAPVELVRTGELGQCRVWLHRLGDTVTETHIELADGRVLSRETLRGVLNRLPGAPAYLFPEANLADAEYATQELLALHLSWLHSLPAPVLNRPVPPVLSGPWLFPFEWHILAWRSGLQTRTAITETEGDVQVILLNSESFGFPLPKSVLQGCRRLSAAVAAPLLGINFAHTTEESWIFAGATPLPDLRLGGDKFISALASALR